MYILHRTRSFRASIFPVGLPQAVVLENMSGNEGLEMQFSVTRSIDSPTSTGTLTVFNLPASIRSIIEGQSSRIGNIDDLLEDGTLWSVGPSEADIDDETAIAASSGYATIKLEAGYDEAVSAIFSGTAMFAGTSPAQHRADGAAASAFGVTTETVISASSGIAQVALSRANETFERGTDTFAVLDHLRRVLKLGPGNVSPANWLKYLADAAGAINKNGQSLFSQTSILSAAYTVTEDAAQQLEDFLKYTGVRYFVDEGSLWLLPRQGFIEGPIAVLAPLKEPPRRPRPGHLECTAFLSPSVAPGRLVRVDAIGVDETASGVYRCDSVTHAGGTSAAEEYTTTVHLSRRQLSA